MSDAQIEKFKELYEELMRYCLRRGIVMADAQDLVGSCLEAALKKFDASRGTFAALAQTALENRVKNYWRDRKPLDPIEGAEDVEDPDARPDFVDEIAHQQERLRGIMATLTSEEKDFLLALQSVLEEMDSRAVSEAARRLGMPPAKGWDLFRRIQRKAVRTPAAPGHGAKYSVAKRPPPPDATVEEMMPMVYEAMDMPAPPAPSKARTGPEPVDATVRALAVFAAMEHAYTQFCSGLSRDSLAMLNDLK